MKQKTNGGDSHHHSSSKHLSLEFSQHHCKSQGQQSPGWAVFPPCPSQPGCHQVMVSSGAEALPGRHRQYL